jgi:hypothetical protein
MTEPVFVALLAADRVITEDNGKKAIIGTFTQFNARQFPAVFPPWFVYAAVTNLAGPHSFSLNVVNDETQQVVFSAAGQFTVDQPRKVVELVVPMLNVVFPIPGTYNMLFNVDGQQIGSRLLETAKVDAPPHHPGTPGQPAGPQQGPRADEA